MLSSCLTLQCYCLDSSQLTQISDVNLATTSWCWLHISTSSIKTLPWTDCPAIVQHFCMKDDWHLKDWGISGLPYVCDGLFVLVVRGPNCYFIPFGADINDGSTHVIAEVVKSFAHEAQKLQEKQMSGPNILLLASGCLLGRKGKNEARCWNLSYLLIASLLSLLRCKSQDVLWWKQPSGESNTVIWLSDTQDDWTYRLQPEAIQVGLALLLRQSDEPAATSSVPFVLPHGLNPILRPNKEAKLTRL